MSSKKIYIKDNSGNTYEIEVDMSTMIGDIAHDFFEIMDWPPQDNLGIGQRAVVEFLDSMTHQYIRLRADQSLKEANIPDGAILSIYPEAIAGCFLGSTKVLMVSGIPKEISKVQVGEWVLTGTVHSDGKVSISSANVKEITVKNEIHLYCINNNLFATGDQKLWSNNKLRPVVQIKRGDWLLNYQANEIIVESITSVTFPKQVKVYNLFFDDDSKFFFVEGIVAGDVITKQLSYKTLDFKDQPPSGQGVDLYVKIISLFNTYPNNLRSVTVDKNWNVEDIPLGITTEQLLTEQHQKGLIFCKETRSILNFRNRLWEQDVKDNYTLLWGEADEILDLFKYADFLSKTPNEIIQQGTKYILNYLQNLESESTGKPHKLLECKLAFLGAGNVGKTCMISMLRTGACDLKSQITHGIEISEWMLHRDKDIVKVNIWDFGGQEITKLIHKLFLTERTVYVIVTSLRQTDYLGQPDLERWLKLVHQYAPQSPIVVAINKIDEESREVIQKESLQSTYPQIIGFVETSCTTPQGIEELKKLILKAVWKLPHIDDLLPAHFFKVKDRIPKFTKNYLHFAEYHEFCKSISTEFNDQDIRSLIGLLNDLGVMLNISQNKLLQDTNILQPEWIVKGIFQVLDNKILQEKYGRVTEKELLGMLDKTLYTSEGDGRIILNFMVHFHFCYRTAETLVEATSRENTYYFPSFFPPDIPKDLSWQPSKCLRFLFRYQDWNDSIFLFFVIQNFYRISKYWLTGCLYSRSGQDENLSALIMADKKNAQLVIEIAGNGNKRSLLEILREEISKINQSLNILPPNVQS